MVKNFAISMIQMFWGNCFPSHHPSRSSSLLCRYLLDEPINFQSVSTARATLDAAHQYLCPELARLAVQYLERNLNSNTVLEIYQGLSLYANHITSSLNRSSNLPTAPPAPGDDAGEIGIIFKFIFNVQIFLPEIKIAIFNYPTFYLNSRFRLCKHTYEVTLTSNRDIIFLSYYIFFKFHSLLNFLSIGYLFLGRISNRDTN